MQKLAVLTACVVIALGSAANAKEYRFGGVTPFVIEGVDAGSIVRTGDIAVAWTIMIPRDETKYAFFIKRYDWDCAKKRQRVTAGAYYSNDGKVVGNAAPQVKWSAIVPDSVSDVTLSVICSTPYRGRAVEAENSYQFARNARAILELQAKFPELYKELAKPTVPVESPASSLIWFTRPPPKVTT